MSQPTAVMSEREIQRLEFLAESGAEWRTRKTKSGKIVTGWFHDGKYLGEDSRWAVEAIKG